MTYEELLKRISPTLKRITYKLNGYAAQFDHEDLFQEALIHLWRAFCEGTLADKTDSYILQGCYFHLKNFLRKNKNRIPSVSIDGYVAEEEDAGFQAMEEKLGGKDINDLIAQMDNRMLIDTIMNNGFTVREKQIFSLSIAGHTTRDIGRRLRISHVRVVKLIARIRDKSKAYVDFS